MPELDSSETVASTLTANDEGRFYTRPFTTADFGPEYFVLIGELHPELGALPFSDAGVDEWLQNPSIEARAVCDKMTGELVGAGTLLVEPKFIRSLGKVGHIEDFVLFHNAISGLDNGPGHHLVAALVELARESRCYKIITDCTVDRKAFFLVSNFTEKELCMTLYSNTTKVVEPGAGRLPCVAVDKGVTLRPLALSDNKLEFLALLAQLTTVGTVDDAAYRERVELCASNRDHVVVVVEDTETKSLVGTGSLFIERKPSLGHMTSGQCRGCGHIEDIVIDEGARGRGLGQLLMTTLTDVGLELGCAKMVLNCSKENAGFYERCGYHRAAAPLQLARYFR